MWLKYGVDAKTRSLVEISQVGSGKTALYCPYCGKGLIAKKGKVKQHHFAHAEETCYPVATKRELPVLPLYDSFDLYLSGKNFDLLKKLWQSCGENGWVIPNADHLKPFICQKLMRKILHPMPGYEFTPLGKIPVAALPLAEFNVVQEPLLQEKLAHLERQTQLAKVIKSLNERERLIDWYIYQAQYKRILQQRLYYLAVKVDGEKLHKIGVTRRNIEERLPEINRDLRSHYQNVEVEVLGIWEHRGNVEKYFKHRYQAFNHRIGSLTEYFKFEQPERVWSDLQQMQPKQLDDVEVEVLESSDRIPENVWQWDEGSRQLLDYL